MRGYTEWYAACMAKCLTGFFSEDTKAVLTDADRRHDEIALMKTYPCEKCGEHASAKLTDGEWITKVHDRPAKYNSGKNTQKS
jgi:hypothetical protein